MGRESQAWRGKREEAEERGEDTQHRSGSIGVGHLPTCGRRHQHYLLYHTRPVRSPESNYCVPSPPIIGSHTTYSTSTSPTLKVPHTMSSLYLTLKFPIPTTLSPSHHLLSRSLTLLNAPPPHITNSKSLHTIRPRPTSPTLYSTTPLTQRLPPPLILKSLISRVWLPIPTTVPPCSYTTQSLPPI